MYNVRIRASGSGLTASGECASFPLSITLSRRCAYAVLLCKVQPRMPVSFTAMSFFAKRKMREYGEGISRYKKCPFMA